MTWPARGRPPASRWIMRRLLRDIAEERDLGDVTTLANPGVVDALRDRWASGA